MPRQPPVNPSPHRFLVGKQTSPPPTKDVKPGPGFRKEVLHSTASTTRSTTQFPDSRQFAATPKFAFSRPKPAPRDQRSPSPPRPAAVQSFRASARPSDEVEDAADVDDDDEMLDGEPDSVYPTTEYNAEGLREDDHWRDDVAYSPKRRRLDTDNTILSPTRPNFKYPGAPASESSRTTSHLTHFPQQSKQASTSSNAASLPRPAFLRPSTEPQEQNEPLPETFSPHKRGQKFVPGGMAATMQQWVIETGQAAVQSRKGQGYLKGEDYVMRAKIDSFTGDGPYTVHARLPNGEAAHVVLAGIRLPNSAQAEEVSEGCVVGVRAPTWEVELEGMAWTVGVDWKILS